MHANFPSELSSKPWPTTSGIAAKITIRTPTAEGTWHDPELLYSLEVLERDGARVKVHYVGYSSTHDEWKDIEEIVTPESEEQQQRSVLHIFFYFFFFQHDNIVIEWYNSV